MARLRPLDFRAIRESVPPDGCADLYRMVPTVVSEWTHAWRVSGASLARPPGAGRCAFSRRQCTVMSVVFAETASICTPRSTDCRSCRRHTRSAPSPGLTLRIYAPDTIPIHKSSSPFLKWERRRGFVFAPRFTVHPNGGSVLGF